MDILSLLDIQITYSDIAISCLRWLIGITIGSIFGLLLGIVSTAKFFDVWLRPMGDVFRAIPILGLVPLVQWYIGFSEVGKIGLIAWGVMFPVWLSVRQAGKDQHDEAELVLTARHLNHRQKLRVYTFPRLVNGLFNGIEIAIGLGWLAVVAAELIATYSQGFWAGGLGYQLFDAFNKRNDLLTGSVAIVIFGALGYSTSRLWQLMSPGLYRLLTGGGSRPILNKKDNA